jgi:hypothetical protein
MDVVVALIGLALVVVVAAYIAQPLVVKARVGASVIGESPHDKLLAERDTLYAAIRDLDLDFQTGKLLETDYRSMRETYTVRGVEILKQLDAMGVSSGQWSVVSDQADQIEAAVRARRRGKARGAQLRATEDEIEAAIRARRQAASRKPQSNIRNPKSKVRNQACPSCGHPFDPTDRFCAKCGAALTVEATR